ncbi:DUF222 domain-containing protein [Pseudonocardia sp. C8]|uniref:HNH endonuclease signature motif containing protein n=1 Tax=Pseudonocardia sp. C8 TaxID=2762759 RepID=UPI001642C601|nr:HNH endonuclease signature motif containing protein [Pseudonocardia sp. C8]MBC3189691.1 DUF222 domain-containing protein [Pseudonocardia sp. C8]
MAEVLELIDRAAGLPPGPELATTLAELPWEKLPNDRLVEVLQARDRQLAHEHAGFYAGLVEISHAAALADLPENTAARAEAVVRSEDQFDWAAGEIAAGLTWTRARAERELGFATTLCQRLPWVFTALEEGRIDLAKARVLVDHLDPGTGDLTDEQARKLCDRFLPQAPGWTTAQLRDRLYRALLHLNPALRRRRYQRAVQARGLALYLDPHTGTATLTGTGLPADEAAAAAARLDRLAAACRRAGHPGTLAQISTDLYLGMLDGAFHGLTEAEIIDRLLACPRPEGQPTDTSTADTSTGESDTGESDTGESDTGEVGAGESGFEAADTASGTEANVDSATEIDSDADSDGCSEADVHSTARSDSGPGDSADGDPTGRDTGPGPATSTDPATKTGTGTGPRAGTGSRPAGGPSTGPAGDRPTGDRPPQDRAATDRWAHDRVATREGIELRVGLGTLAGRDDRPGDIPGLGPITAHTARIAATTQRRGARWIFAITDPDGYLLLAGPLRRRPRTRVPNDRNGPKPPGAPQTPRTPDTPDTPGAPGAPGAPGMPGTPNRSNSPNPPGAPPGAPPVRGGVVELHISLDELDRYATDPQLADWHPLLAEIAHAWADRDTRHARLDADPTARFARGPLATHIHVRDRTCIGPGCTRPARRSELDHTTDHDHGGPTVPANIGPCCGRHHTDKHRGWTLTQPQPARFCWTSPLGRTYRTRGEPVRPDLPDPEPTAPESQEHEQPGEQSAAEVDRDLRKHDTPLLRRPATNPPLPPPPKPQTKPDDEPPPF